MCPKGNTKAPPAPLQHRSLQSFRRYDSILATDSIPYFFAFVKSLMERGSAEKDKAEPEQAGECHTASDTHEKKKNAAALDERGLA